jgi:PAS domain S-box-containing protein
MELETLPQFVPYIASLLISLGIGYYAWQRRAVPGAVPFAILVFAQAAWTFGYIFELASDTLDAKIFWDNFQFIGGAVWPAALLAFAVEYTGRKLANPRVIWGLVMMITAVILLIVYTDDHHHLIRPNAEIIPNEPFDVLTYDFTITLWLMFFYLVGLLGYSLFLLVNRSIPSFRLYRTQIGLVVVGNTIPLIGATLTITGVTISAQRDISPLTFALGNMVVAWGLFRYQLLDLVPIAREQVIEHMRDMVLVMDTQDRLVDLNPAARRILNRPASELIGQPLEAVFSSWVDLVEQYRSIDTAHTEVLIRQEDDQLYFDLTITPLRNRGGRLTGRLAIIRDITRYKKAELEIQQRTLELEAANKRLLALSQVKDEFVSNVSHELQTPLTNLKINEHLIRSKPENTDVYLERMERETERLARIIEDLLRLSRLDQESAPFTRQLADLTELTREYVHDRVPLAEQKKIRLTHQGMAGLPLCSVDSGLIGLVLSILLTNALNYTPEGGEIVVSTREEEFDGLTYVGFSVRDSGPGIPENERDQLFTRFFRGSAGRKSGVPGTGLGLALAWEIVQRHQGRIEVDTNIEDQGAMFFVWLPVSTTSTKL